MKYIVGIDEVGRGPLAGPVAVGVFIIEEKNLKIKEVKDLLKISNDSKKLSPQKREEIFNIVKKLNKNNILRYIVRYESAKFIDKKGINVAISSCIKKGLNKLKVLPNETQIFLDGGLKAEEKFIYQKTIIKGDMKNKMISLASIVAKVSRDKIMVKIAKKYPKYGFEIHKGYGTSKHRLAMRKHGLSELHRVSFCRRIVQF